MSGSTLEVRHIALIDAIATEGSLAGAARTLGYSQPAISQQLSLLEKRLNTTLALRSRQGVTLTEAGDLLLRNGRTLLDILSRTEAQVASIEQLKAGRIRIAAFPSAGATFVATAMGRMTRSHPGLTFTLRDADPPHALDLLNKGECDIALVFDYPSDEFKTPVEDNYSYVHLFDEQVYVALPAELMRDQPNPIDLSVLRNARWIAGCPSCRGNLVNLCQTSGFEPEIAFETDDYVALQNLASQGLGVALLPDLFLAAVQVPDLNIRTIRQISTRRVWAVSLRAIANMQSIQITLEELRHTARSLPFIKK